MWLALRRSVTVLAIYTVALHTTLWGIAPAHSALPVDPLSVICHSEASAPANPTPIHGPLSSASCDHCNLCSAATPPVPLETALAIRFEPARTLRVLRPVNLARHDGIASDSKLARGPPAFALT